jgi:hypothetical protein
LSSASLESESSESLFLRFLGSGRPRSLARRSAGLAVRNILIKLLAAIDTFLFL